VLNVSALYLRLASVIIPLPFGLVVYARERVGIRGALLLGIVTATFAIFCMLTVTGLNDNVPIIPGPWIEWREAIPVPQRAAADAVPLDEGEPLNLECRHFLDCIATGATPRTDGREGLRVLRVLR